MNINGDFAGIILRKSQTENLNFAVPANEFLNLPKDKGKFYAHKVGLIAIGKMTTGLKK